MRRWLRTVARGWRQLNAVPGRLKSRPRMALEMLAWLVSKREWPRYYFEYGFHRQRKSRRDYMEIPRFKKLNYRLNTLAGVPRGRIPQLKQDIHYLILVRDKLLCNKFLRGLNLPAPHNVCLLSRTELLSVEAGTYEPLEGIGRRDFSGFLKNVLGESGEEVVRLRSGGGRIAINDRETDLDALRRFIRLRAVRQETIVQHPEMSRLFPRSVNTIRLTTLNSGGDIVPFAAVLRMGSGEGFVDNISRGGVAVRVILPEGRLGEQGVFHKPAFHHVTAHPDTGVVFAGFRIPFFAEALALALRAHRLMYGLFSVGWDIAITPAGPLIIEGNDNWSMPGHQIMEGRGLKAEYLGHAAAFRRWHAANW